MNLVARFRSFYAWLVKYSSYLQSPVLLAMRAYWGWQFFTGGKGKLEDVNKVADYFSSLNIPMPKLNAVLAGSTECFGGLLLLLGLGSRLVTIPLVFTMVVAYLTAENDSLKAIFDDPDKFTGATPFLFLLTSVIVFAFGPGVFSLDWLIAKIWGQPGQRPRV